MKTNGSEWTEYLDSWPDGQWIDNSEITVNGKPDLFPGTKPARSKPRVMMKATDHGFCDEIPDHPEMGHMVCQKCGHDAGWMNFATRTEVKNGAPCPVCNGDKSDTQAASVAIWESA